MSDNTRIVRDATCTFCGCVCDDMHLTVDIAANKITKAENACVLGRAWFKEHGIEERPFALVGGREASTAEAIEEAAQILAKARFPVIYGLSDTTCEAQRQAVAIGDMIGGNVDTTTSVCHGPSSIAFQGVGRARRPWARTATAPTCWCSGAGMPPSLTRTCSRVTRYGERDVRAERPEGSHRGAGRCTPHAKRGGGGHLRAGEAQRDFEVLWALRALVKGRRVDPGIER